MTTLPLSHPLARGIKTAHNFCTKHGYAGHKGHPSSLHELLNEFKINQEKMEKITPICQFPKWIPDVTTSIAQKEEEAVKEEETADEDLRVYSDGSAIDGGVGAAAVLMRGAKIVSEKRFHLGSDKDHTVYDGEVVGMILAVKLLKEAGGRGTMSLGVDNQAAIRSTGAFRSQPGHYLVDKFHDDLRDLLPDDDDRKLKIRWTPGHKGIAGNEAADKQAKRAAKGETSKGNVLPKSLAQWDKTPSILPRSKSAAKQVFHSVIKGEANKTTLQSPRCLIPHTIDPSAPSKDFASLIEDLPRRHSSLLFQLRTGHVPLNKHLHQISKSPTAQCLQCNGGEETVHHFLVVCPNYARQRDVLREEVGTRRASQLKCLLNEKRYIRALFRYIARTRRLEQVFGDVTPPSRKKKNKAYDESSKSVSFYQTPLVGISVLAPAA